MTAMINGSRLAGLSRRVVRALCMTGALTLVPVHALAADTAGVDFFESKIRPLLVKRCVSCHGAKKQRGGLRLDSRMGWERGGDSGPALVPGKPEKSLL